MHEREGIVRRFVKRIKTELTTAESPLELEEVNDWLVIKPGVSVEDLANHKGARIIGGGSLGQLHKLTPEEEREIESNLLDVRAFLEKQNPL